MHTCETCGNEWPETYCPECGRTIGKVSKPVVPPLLPPTLPTPEPPAAPTSFFGFLKRRKPTASPQPPLPSPLSGASNPPEIFWDENGLGRLVPIYLQLHLASKSSQHTLARRPNGTIDTDEVPGLMIFWDEDPRRQQQIRTDFTRLMREQLPNDAAALSVLTVEEVVTRLCDIYTKVTGKDMYAVVCKKWCVEHKLLR